MSQQLVSALFQALGNRDPEAAVLVGDHKTWTAREIIALTETLRERLSDCRTLAVLADNSPAWIMADLAAMSAGVTHVPLPTFFSPEQLSHVLDASATDIVLTDQPERIGALERGFAITGHWQGLTCLRRPPAPADTTLCPAGTAKISFTSGSTGNPKGVCLSPLGLLDTATAVAARLHDLTVSQHLVTLPLALLLENVAGIYAPLLRGATVHVPSLANLGWRGMAGFDPARLHAKVETVRPSSMILVPELLKAWSLYLASTRQQAPDSLAFVAVGGARVDVESIRLARQLGVPAYQGYGMTECGSVVSLNRPGDDGDDAGQPLSHVDVRIVDGEIVIASRAFLGYLGHSDVADGVCQAAEGRREHATGDLGEIDGTGHIRLFGRSRNLLITSFGRNISPEWVESVLLAQPAILQAVVYGDARPFLTAILVPMPGLHVDALKAAVDAANAQLPDYARLGGWISSESFSHLNGTATGNGRPLRDAILACHQAAFTALYADTNTATTSSLTEEETDNVLL